ncbi:MAG: AMP-binding protein [Candidatus Saganbacteria bacterium]|nr:AMP-binding protein [Candidatus Saganbacteria bacterium]
METLKDFVTQNTRLYGEHVAFQIKREGVYQKFTFAETGKMVESLAYSLQELGIERGCRVAIIGENRPEWAISFLAVVYLGAVAVPLDVLLTEENIINFLLDSEAKVIIGSGKLIGLLEGLKSKVPSLKAIISMEKEAPVGVYSFNRVVSRETGVIKQVPTSEDLASLVYTSGTTGNPKGVMLTHRNIVFDVLAVVPLFDFSPKDNFLSVLPIHHTFETTAGFLGPYHEGAKITYAESLKSYQIVANMQETGVTIMCGVPLLYQLFYDAIIRKAEEKGMVAKISFSILSAVSYFFSQVIGINIGAKLFKMVHKNLGGKLRFFVSGGAAIDPAVIRGFDSFGITILQGYGLTESAPILTCCALKHNKIGSVGRVVPGVELKIKNPDGLGVGEIVARGPNIMKGYYKRKDLTGEVLVDGWLHTGDLGYIDEEGYVFITGRAKDVIVTGSGMNVYPEELEFILNRLPQIKESCVVGIKVKEGLRKGAEEAWAVIVPNHEYFEKYAAENGVSLSPDLIRSIIKEQIYRFNIKETDYKRIVNFVLSEAELPKTSTRKIQRFKVKREFGLL